LFIELLNTLFPQRITEVLDLFCFEREVEADAFPPGGRKRSQLLGQAMPGIDIPEGDPPCKTDGFTKVEFNLSSQYFSAEPFLDLYV